MVSPVADRQSRPSVCVIGAGRISEEHLRYLSGSQWAYLAGVCDLDEILAVRAASQFGGVHASTDHLAMLASLKPECVHIVTPVQSHRGLVEDSLAAHAKLVVIEKPAGASLAETEAMVHDAERVGALLTEDHNYRFNRPVLELLEIIEGGVLGEVREVEVRMSMELGQSRYNDPYERRMRERSQGGVLREFLPHLAYLALLFNPAAVVRDVVWDKLDMRTTVETDDLAARLADPAGDGPQVRLRFASGIAPTTTSVTLRGTRGWAEADLQNSSLRTSRPRAVGDALSPLVDQAIGGVTLVRGSAGAFMNKLRGSAIYEGIGVYLERTYSRFTAGRPLPVTHTDMIAAARLIEDLTEGLPQ